MGGEMDGKVSMLSKKAKFLVKLEMLQKKQPSPGWKTSGINYRVLIGKYLKHGPARLFFKALADKVLLEKGKQTKGSKNPNKDSPFHLPSMLPGERSMNQLSYGKVTSHVVLEDEMKMK